MSQDKPHRLAFPALLFGNVVLAFGPWLVRLSDVGSVAVGFWRLVLALPFLWLLARATGQPGHWPRRSLLLIVAAAAFFYALDLAAWNAYTSTYKWEDFYGYQHVNFAPLSRSAS